MLLRLAGVELPGLLHGGARRCTLRLVHPERVQLEDGLAELRERHRVGGDDGEHATEDTVQAFRDGEDLAEVVWIFEVRGEGAVVECRRVPRRLARRKVEKDNAGGPDVAPTRVVGVGNVVTVDAL